MTNLYSDALKKSKINDTKMILSPKRQVVKDQKGKCYLCEKAFGNTMCYFSEIDKNNSKDGEFPKKIRAICSSCYFSLEKKPTKIKK